MAKMPSTSNRIWYMLESVFWALVLLFVFVCLVGGALTGFVHAPGRATRTFNVPLPMGTPTHPRLDQSETPTDKGMQRIVTPHWRIC